MFFFFLRKLIIDVYDGIIVQIIVVFVEMFIMVINYILFRLTALITICLL